MGTAHVDLACPAGNRCQVLRQRHRGLLRMWRRRDRLRI